MNEMTLSELHGIDRRTFLAICGGGAFERLYRHRVPESQSSAGPPPGAIFTRRGK
jgi:hypothetical protein